MFSSTFFPFPISEENKLYLEIRKSKTCFGPKPNSVYNNLSPTGLNYLTRLRLGLRHLSEHKFKHNFSDCINPLCSCSFEVESVSYFFLQSYYFPVVRTTFVNELRLVDPEIFNEKVDIFLIGIDSMQG